MNTEVGQTLPDPGSAGHSAPELAPVYSLDMNQVSALFDTSDLPRSRRTLLRYCQHDKLDCTKVETMHGEQYFVSEASVQRLVAEILERERFTRPPQRLTASDTHPGTPGQAGAGLGKNGGENTPLGNDGQATPDPGQAGQDTKASPAMADERLLKQVSNENELLRTQMEVKDKQIERMNGQIDDLIERGREDKHLLQNFQRKLGMLAAPEEAEREDAPFEPARRNGMRTLYVDSADTSPDDMV